MQKEINLIFSLFEVEKIKWVQKKRNKWKIHKIQLLCLLKSLLNLQYIIIIIDNYYTKVTWNQGLELDFPFKWLQNQGTHNLIWNKKNKS